jgi:hypothetical protein
MIKFDARKLDNDFVKTIEQLADTLKVDPVVFIENIILSRMAADQAADDVYQGGLQFMPEFLQYDGQQLRGRELYKMMYNLKRRELEQERLQYIEQAGLKYSQLPKEDQELLKRYKMDAASKDKKKQDKADLQSMIDSGDLIIGETTWNKDK